MTIVERVDRGTGDVTPSPALEGAISGQAEAHADSVVRACYTQLHLDPTLRPIIDMTRGAMEERGMSPSFATNLLFRGIQSMERSRTAGAKRKYPAGYESSLKWHSVLSRIIRNEDELSHLHKILLTRNTSTNIYERFMGPTAIAAHVFGDTPITVADLGCSANYGLLGTAAGILFKALDADDTGVVGDLVDRGINLFYGVGVDIEDPNTPEARQWRRDCIYPSELTRERLREIDLFDNLDQHTAPNVAFVNADALQLPSTVSGFDVVSLSTMCYQLEIAQQVAMFESAKQIVNSDGIIIVQDFAHKAEKGPKSPLGIEFDSNWTPFSYRTFAYGARTNNEMLELFKWKNGRCEAVTKGLDFNKFFAAPAAPTDQPSSVRAA